MNAGNILFSRGYVGRLFIIILFLVQTFVDMDCVLCIINSSGIDIIQISIQSPIFIGIPTFICHTFMSVYLDLLLSQL